MAKDLVDVLATDLVVSSLAERAPVESDDPALRLLEAWAADIDARPIAADIEVPEPMSLRRRPRGAARSVAAMTIALTLSSSGIAAAVQGNPFAPINFVVHKFGQFGFHDRSSPVDMLGAHNGAAGDPRQKEARTRLEHHGRPSRSGRPDRATQPESQTPPPLVSQRVVGPGASNTPTGPNASGGGTQGRPSGSRHHGPLVVRHPGPPPVESPKPGGSETPPNRPEMPAMPGSPSWPKPSQGQSPVPPDAPSATGSGNAPVR